MATMLAASTLLAYPGGLGTGASAPSGASVTVLWKESSYYYIQYSNTCGYVSTAVVSLDGASVPTQSISYSNRWNQYSYAVSTYYGPGSSYRSAGSIGGYEQVSYLGVKQNNYAYIEYATTSGYKRAWIDANALRTTDPGGSTTYSVRITFNANGGTGAPSAQTYTGTSTSVSCTLPSTVPGRTDYEFLGWSQSASATYATYQPGSTYNMTGSAAGTSYTLYAVWRQKRYQVKVTYNANGGSGAPVAQTFTSATSSSISCTLSTTEPTRADYEFLGWSQSSTASYATYQPGSTYNLTGSTDGTNYTFYAVWRKKQYSVTINYYANGGSGAPSAQTFTSYGSSSISCTLSTVEPTRTDYEFLGWSQTSTATYATYQPGETYSMAGSTDGTTYNFYAIWRKKRYQVTIAYNANGGSGAPTAQTFTNADSSSVSCTLTTAEPTRTDYEFLGWSQTAGASYATYQPGGTYSMTGSTDGTTYTLYAIWRKKRYQVTVNYNANGGTGAPAAQTVTDADNSTLSVTLSTAKPTREGYSFIGWAQSATATEAAYAPGETCTFTGTLDGAEITLYAVWSQAGVVFINGTKHFAFVFDGSNWVPAQVWVHNGSWQLTTGG